MKIIDLAKSFQDFGYKSVDDSMASPRTLPSFSFDPTSVDYPISTSGKNDDDEEKNRIDTAAFEIMQQQKNMSFNKKQLMLTNMWK